MTVLYEKSVRNSAEAQRELDRLTARKHQINRRRALAARNYPERWQREKARRAATRANPPRIVPEPPTTRPPDFRVALDARIDHCPGCDAWRFDRTCQTCLTTTIPRSQTA